MSVRGPITSSPEDVHADPGQRQFRSTPEIGGDETDMARDGQHRVFRINGTLVNSGIRMSMDVCEHSNSLFAAEPPKSGVPVRMELDRADEAFWVEVVVAYKHHDAAVVGVGATHEERPRFTPTFAPHPKCTDEIPPEKPREIKRQVGSQGSPHN